MMKFDKRTYHYKNPTMEFYCPLCSTPRAFTSTPRLSLLNYLQMSLLTVLLTKAFYPFIGFAGLLSFFLIWPIFEFVVRAKFRQEIPCPHCGFDASWYKRDVKMARKAVEEFWEDKRMSEEKGCVEALQNPPSNEKLSDFKEEIISENQ